MTTLAVAVIAAATGLACYWLGVWMERRTTPTRDFLIREYMAANRRTDRYRLAWLSACRRARHGRSEDDALLRLHGSRPRDEHGRISPGALALALVIVAVFLLVVFA